ncbi:MAG TPA: Crp/Fnr family transcriptional regulator [Pseudonocardiaceae bacterium]
MSTVPAGQGGPDVQPIKGTLLSALAPADRDHLLALGDRRRFAEHDVLLRQGDPTDHVLVLLAGWVRVYSTNVVGQEVVLAIRGPGDVLGELGALHGWTRTVSLRAMEPVRVLQLRRQQFVDCLRERPDIAIALVKQVSTRLRDTETALQEFATQDVSRRVAGHLLRIARQHGVEGPDGIELDIPLSQQEIANRVGASPRGVARAMAMLRDRGMLTTARRRIVIVRPSLLRSFAGNQPNGR